jgi:hypothetical protein
VRTHVCARSLLLGLGALQQVVDDRRPASARDTHVEGTHALNPDVTSEASTFRAAGTKLAISAGSQRVTRVDYTLC